MSVMQPVEEQVRRLVGHDVWDNILGQARSHMGLIYLSVPDICKQVLDKIVVAIAREFTISHEKSL
jgi:hypothetical protein